MKTLQVQNISLSFGEREILKNVSFNMAEGTRAALAGANGCGKSTLLKIISNKLQADDFHLSMTKDARVSYLPQSDIVLDEKSIYSIAEEGYSRFDEIKERISSLEEKTQVGGDEAQKAAEQLAILHESLIDSGYYDRRGRIEKILQGLGFKQSDLSRPASEFSGGYQMRVALARILVENPDFMFLDEPTNYLDIEALTWLENYLKSFSGGLMIVSHDQDFLDTLVTEVYELFNGKLTRYQGNYSKYIKTRDEEIEALEKAFKRQQEEISKTEDFIERFRYKATKAKQVQSRIKQLDKIETIEIPGHLRKLTFSFPPAPHSGNDVLKIENLSKSYGSLNLYKDFSFLVKKHERLAITGRNGAGKSTLLRMLAGVDTSFDGEIIDGAGVIKGYFAQDTENTLNPDNTVIEELESVATVSDQPRLRSLLGSFLFSDDDVFKKVNVLSGGEKSRLALLKILIHPSNLLLLDEPTNHLDINAKEMLAKALSAYEGTVILVSHDKHFIKTLATRILYISDEGPEFFEGDYNYFEYKLEEKEKQWEIKKAQEKAVETQSVQSGVKQSYQVSKEKRNQIKSLEREIEKLNKTLETEEKNLEDVNYKMGLVENYSDAKKITALQKEKEEIEARIEDIENQWFEKSTLLEELNAESN